MNKLQQRWQWVCAWRLWQLRPLLVIWYLLVPIAALVITGVTLAGSLAALTSHQLILAGALLGLGVVQAESSGHVERVRRSVNTVRHVNLTSVWSFAATLLLPTGLACTVTLLLLTHHGVRSWTGTRPLHRQVFNPAAVLVTIPPVQALFFALAPYGFTSGGAPFRGHTVWLLLAVSVAVIAYWLLDMVLIAVALALLGDRARLRQFSTDMTNNALDLATNCLGALVAAILVVAPWLVLLFLIPVLVMHRSVLVKELEDKATRDQKTGLLNATAWRQQTERELARAGRTGDGLGVVMVDLDHFKNINDRYGHPAGDDVLAAVAAILRDETRQYDSAGRFGGEEFALLLPENALGEVGSVAERIRVRISELLVDATTSDGPVQLGNLTASLGVARYPNDGTKLIDLIAAADDALYAAKNNGRNRVVHTDADAHRGYPVSGLNGDNARSRVDQRRVGH
ncbi:GGDEF domain-containing protein [Sciscionella marina]|uniref:GGDEF domain-containing protein n=1 Tax=Sciscionella marina TaxID=508770 RepID=UPI00036A3E67|nr:GGDEF domain-containing protein [Sciscionella marina]